MSFTIPNKSILYPFQSRIFQSDIDILQAAVGGSTGVIASGCAVTESTTPDMLVHVAAGQVVIDFEQMDVSATSVGIADADPLLPRFDLVVVHDDALCTALTGVPDAAPFPVSPVPGSVGIKQVFVPAAATSINNAKMVDKRVFVPSPLAASNWIMLSATTDLTRVNNAAQSADPALTFLMNANVKYRIRGMIPFTIADGFFNGSSIQFGFSGPAAPISISGSVSSVSASGLGGVIGLFKDYSYFNVIGGSQNGTGGPAVITLDAVVQNGPNAGAFAFMWAQQVAGPAISPRRAGAYLEYQVI